MDPSAMDNVATEADAAQHNASMDNINGEQQVMVDGAPDQGLKQWSEAITGESSWQVPVDAQANDTQETNDDVSAIDEMNGQEAGDASGVVEELANADAEAADASWIAQYDPSSNRVYYYNTQTGSTQWDQPEGFMEGTRDDKMDGAVKIQSIFRSKKARDRVKQMGDAGKLSARSSRSLEASPTDEHATLLPQSTGNDQASDRVWREHFDPRTQQYYYHNISTNEVTWENPIGLGHFLAESDSQGDSATKIQCAFRKKAASKSMETKKQAVRDLTCNELMDQKLKDLMRAVDEIQSELDARCRSLEGSVDYPHLQDSIASWQLSATHIRDRVLDHFHHAQLVQQLESVGSGEKLTTAQQFHDALAATRSECLALLRTILQLDAYFVEVDVVRVNGAYLKYTKTIPTDELFTISESKIRQFIHVDELDAMRSMAEKALRKAMGMTDFNAGATTGNDKIYRSWRDDVHGVVDSLAQLERAMAQKKSLLGVFKQSLRDKKEASEMEHEDQLSAKRERAIRKRENDRRDRGKFLALCSQKWQQGVAKRQADEKAIQEAVHAAELAKQQEKERQETHRQAVKDRRARVKLSIWEAVREGHAVDVIRTMIFAEMQKARQNGYDFLLRSARSDRGETLVQIACWAGHTELVSFLLDEGADLHGVDSFYNQFTLLHDAARRGHAQIIRLLITRELQQDVVDRAGDTPLHWAVRTNHYEAVHTLLGAHMHRHDPKHTECALRAARLKNHRGRTPIQLAKSECMRRLLQAFDEGRLRVAPFRRPTLSSIPSPPHGNRRMTETSPSGMRRSGSFRSSPDSSGIHLTKASTAKALSTIHSSQARHHAFGDDHDEFGAKLLSSASL